MNELAIPFAQFQRRLREMLNEAAWPSPETAFADHVLNSCGQSAPRRAVVTERLGEAPMLAAGGYQYSSSSFDRSALHDSDWAANLERLSSRNAFPVDRESYFYRPLELIGLCLGARFCPAVDHSHRDWLKNVVEQGRDRLQPGSPSYLLSALAASTISVKWDVLHFQADLASLTTLCLLHWLAAQEEFVRTTGLSIDAKAVEVRILELALSTDNQVADVAEAALVLTVTSSIFNARIQSQIEQSWSKPVHRQDAIRIVANLCDRFPIAVNALKSRHSNRSTITMTDEYDVQDLLGALLKLHFDDVRPEEWTPSYAGNSSRIDFLLKSFGVLVEVKMTRKGLDQKEITNQLAIDILRYQAHQDCKTLLCFVYDPEGHCKNPTVLQNDLTKLHGALDVQIIVRPLLR